MALFKKEPTQEDQLQQNLRAWLSQQAGKTIALANLNAFFYQNDFFKLHYFAESGFQADNKQPVLTATVTKDAQKKLSRIKETELSSELKINKKEKSLLDGIITSDQNYFRLYVTPSPFATGLLLLEKLPATKVFQADKKTGSFVQNNIKELLYLCYRFDLAKNPQLAVKNLALAQLATTSLTLPILTTLTAIANQTITDLDLEYLFTWVLQYSATITATSTLFSAYASAALPEEVLEKTQAIVTELAENFARSSIVLTQNANQDSLAISEQLLKQIPDLFQAANQKMTALNDKLLNSDTDQIE